MNTALLILPAILFATAEDLPSTDSVRPPRVASSESVTTEHSITLGGRTIDYEAIAATLPLFEEIDGSVEAEVFHVAYLRRMRIPRRDRSLPVQRRSRFLERLVASGCLRSPCSAGCGFTGTLPGG